MTNTPAAGKPVTPDRLMQIMWGYSIPLVIEAASRHRVFDALENGSKTIDQISQQTGTSVRGLRAVLNTLVSIELMKKEGDRYSLTPESAAFLVSSKPASLAGFFTHMSGQIIPKWLTLGEVLRTGKPAMSVNEEGEGSEFFEKFVESIFPMSYAATQVLAEALRLPTATAPVKVLDIAAGSGVWGIGLAQKSPQVTVTAVDWPKVIPVTRKVATRLGLIDRFKFIEGNIQDVNLGQGHNLATLGHILHSEGAAASEKLIKRVFDALAPGGTIVIAEFVPNDDRTGPPGALIFAVNMLVNTDVGDTFTYSEIRGWLEKAGFTDVRRLEAPAPSPLILATRPR